MTTLLSTPTWVQSATRKVSSRLGPLAARLYARWQWTLTPLALALGVRMVVLFCTQYALRLFGLPGEHGLIKLWDHYDATWYFSIVQYGYAYPLLPNHTASNVAFFPVFPMLLWVARFILQPVLGDDALSVAGLLVPWLAFIGAAVLLYRLVLDLFDKQVAFLAVILISVYPFSVFFGVPYTESLYLLLAVVAFLAIERRMWWLAGAVALVASAVRPTGILVGVCVVLAYALDWYRTRHPLRPDVLALVLTPLGLLAYLSYGWLRFGDFFAYTHAVQHGWHRGTGISFGGVGMVIHVLLHPSLWAFTEDTNLLVASLYAFSVVACLVSVFFVYRKLGKFGPVYAAFTLLSILMPLLSYNTLTSMGRYTSVIFPFFIVLALGLRRLPALREIVIIGFSISLVVVAMLFTMGHNVFY